MSTQLTNTNEAQIHIDDEYSDIKQFVIFAESQTVGIDGIPILEIPLDLVDDDPTAKCLVRAMIEASETYTDADGWAITYKDAATVGDDDMRRLCERLQLVGIEDEWAEFVGLPDGVCIACGGAGYLVMDMCADGVKYELRGDCEGCDSTGRL